MTDKPSVSIIVPVAHRFENVVQLADEYIAALDAENTSFEMIFVIDGDRGDAFSQLQTLPKSDKRVRVVKFARSFGEATAISVGFHHSKGEVILTLPAYHQIEATAIGRLLEALESSDVAVAKRTSRAAKSRFEVFRRRLFHWLIKMSSGEAFSDLGCSARAIRRTVLEEIRLYGEQHSFLPLLAAKQGFRVVEIDVPQSPEDRYDQPYTPKVYLRRLLDIFSVVFLVRFTKKPLRFFGMIGSITFVVGGLLLAILIVQRTFFSMPLADRPALLVASLLTVLGLQIFALGLLGELIIFANAREMKEYTIEKIVN